MTTKPTRRPRTPRPTPDTASTVDVIIAPVADVATVDAPAPVATVDAVDARIAAAFPDVTIPPVIAHMARAFAAVAGMPVVTRDDRDAVRAAIVAHMETAMPGAAVTASRTVGRFTTWHVFESQNAAYVAAAMSGAYITDGHFVAMWAADLPNARCPYIDRVSYPTSTLSEYMGGRHGIVPMGGGTAVPGARDVINAWMTAKRNRPTA